MKSTLNNIMRPLLIGLLGSLAISATASPKEVLAADIDALVSAVAGSGCEFIRNGKRHSAEESVKQIARKYAHFEEEIDSIETFVSLTATRSLMSGKAYQVQCGTEITSSEQWMLEKAAELRILNGPEAGR